MSRWDRGGRATGDGPAATLAWNRGGRATAYGRIRGMAVQRFAATLASRARGAGTIILRTRRVLRSIGDLSGVCAPTSAGPKTLSVPLYSLRCLVALVIGSGMARFHVSPVSLLGVSCACVAGPAPWQGMQRHVPPRARSPHRPSPLPGSRHVPSRSPPLVTSISLSSLSRPSRSPPLVTSLSASSFGHVPRRSLRYPFLCLPDCVTGPATSLVACHAPLHARHVASSCSLFPWPAEGRLRPQLGP